MMLNVHIIDGKHDPDAVYTIENELFCGHPSGEKIPWYGNEPYIGGDEYDFSDVL